jgi:hypothetical protein
MLKKCNTLCVIIRMIKSRRMRWAGHVERMGEKWNAFGILMGESEGKRFRNRQEDNIKMDLREIGWGGMEWIDLALNRDQLRVFVNTAMNLRVP